MIGRFVRAMLMDMASVGGHVVQPDEAFWVGFGQAVAEAIPDPERLHLVAEESGRIVGFLDGRAGALPGVFAPKRSLHISGVYVVPESRRHGVATALVREALRWGVEQDCHEADLHVLPENEAESLYRSLGFQVHQQEMRMKLR